MSGTTEQTAIPSRPKWAASLWKRQLDTYPDTRPRIVFLAITVLATCMLYYELYVGGSVSTLILVNLNMSFTFYVITIAFGALIGAFGSLAAGLGDRLGRANIVVAGLLFTAVFVTFVLPAATAKWPFTIESFVVSFVEGTCLVATPALIRDFSPQVGRATAMGFWTSGPVVGSLIVAVVGSATIPDVVTNPRFWTHEYYICGIAGLVVWAIAFFGLKELSPRLRDQLMVTLHDRALIEAKAKGMTEADIEAALKHPFRQLLKPDIIVSAFAVSIMLLIYYTAVLTSLIYLTTVFGFSIKNANGLGNWNWGFNAIGVILIGVISDRFRVRKPFMVIGGVIAAITLVVFLEQAGHHPGYYTLAIMLAVLALGLGIAYTPWMASYTETVESRNPALTATGLAIWGWIIRIVVFVSYLFIPVVINSVTPLVNYGATVQQYATKYSTQLAAAQSIPPDVLATAQTLQKNHPEVLTAAQKIPPAVLATAKADSVQLANAQKFAPELRVIQANPALFAKLATYSDPAKIPPALVGQAIKAAGGGATGVGILTTISQNKAAINGVIAVAPALQTVAPYATDLQTIAPYAAQLNTIAPYSAKLALASQIPPNVSAYLQAHGAAVTKAAAQTAGQWKTWYWICVGGIIFFLLSIPLLKGRWRTRDAKRDEAEHEAMVDAELAKLSSSA
ncbi:MAG TPA: MFS transporter [Streptosporangiaceae bacterium]|nr:MFS transporter [Streptosporangiaceae bacterium]